MAVSGLAGCSTFGMGSDQMATGSTGYQGTSNLNQQMPPALGQVSRVADNGPYTPPADIGSGSSPGMAAGGQDYPTYAGVPPASAATSHSFSSQDLPVIGATSSTRSLPAMSAQPAQRPMASISSVPKPLAAAPGLSAAPAGTYTHVIKSGESLYTIAKHYGVTAQSIMIASGISAPDKIFVGQRVVIPGRPDLLASMDDTGPSPASAQLPVDSSKPTLATASADIVPLHQPHDLARGETHVASLGNADQSVVSLAGRILANGSASPGVAAHGVNGRASAVTPMAPPAKSTPLARTNPVAKASPAATTVASAPQAAPRVPMQEPAVSGASKFRWPLSGKVIVDFAASRGTGINIAAPAGTPVKAVENGTVIYVGSGVEGYGNLILIRHANGYVSAYADLKDMNVQKNAVVARGDTIGTAGMTGSVTSPQLHFELRKGATPVDPVPLLAG